jgi:hypothetical protein
MTSEKANLVPPRKQEILLREGNIFVREIFERNVGNQQKMLKSLMGDNLTFLPNVFPAMHDFCLGTWFGAYADGVMVAAAELDYFPIPGAILAKRTEAQEAVKKSDTQEALEAKEAQYTIHYTTEQHFADNHPKDRREEWLKANNMVRPPRHVLKWRHSEIRLFALSRFKDDRTELRHVELLAIKDGKPFIINLPNIFDDGRICMGNNERQWQRHPEHVNQADVVPHFQNALNTIATAPANMDLYREVQDQAIRFNEKFEPIDCGAVTRILRPVTSELSIAFFNFISGDIEE